MRCERSTSLPFTFAGERGAREAGADGAGDFGSGYGPGKGFLRAVGETDVRHQTWSHSSMA